MGRPLPSAQVVELVDTRDLKSLGATRAGSSPALGTKSATLEAHTR